MTRTLLLIRHAKAADGPVDVERPLTPRGRRDADALGDWLHDHGPTLDRVVVSPARRAQETWSQAAAGLQGTPEVDVDERVYENTVDALLEIVRDTADGVATLALVGHNPSFGALADGLDDGTGDPDAREQRAAGFPTCAVAVFEIDGAWEDVTPGEARLVEFAAPRG